MNKTDVGRVIMTLQTAYPKTYMNMTPEQRAATIELWNYQFKDYDVSTVLIALQQYISNDDKGFAPVIGQIKKIIIKNMHLHDASPEDAWEHVKANLQGSYSSPNANFKKLTHLEQRAVGSPNSLRDIGQMGSKELEFEKSSFIKRYERLQLENEKMESLPSSTRNYIESLAANLSNKLSMNSED